LDKDVPRNWQPAVTIVAARFGRSVEIVTEEQFLPDGIVHKADYGFFAGGGGLSRAAYFRVYAARYLLTTGKFLRALYTDTDIVCRGDLTALVHIDLGGRPIAAKIEDYSREVRDAAERNAIDPYRYFNSGVLVFDFAHPDAATGIDAAIRISETEPDRLIFHDQCALNIAFTHQFSELPAAFNFFLRPNRERNGFIEDAILLHYLDKPKPWDIVFDRTYREEWRVWAMYLSMVVPQSLYIDMFAASNAQ
jgi:lipopolysaccharide biosynthesis glycosyltransferase